MRMRLAFGSLLFGACLTLTSHSVFAAEVESFSPRGVVRQIRQVRAVFSEDMVPAGQPQAPNPFTLTCPEKGSGRWINSKNWIYDFTRDLPTDVACTFELKPGLSTLSGQKLEGETKFEFKTGSPSLTESDPYSGDQDIAEDQYFFLMWDGDLSEADVLSSLSIAVDGIESKLPVEIVKGSELATLSKASRFRYHNKKIGYSAYFVRAKQRFPNEAKVRIQYASNPVLEYRVRPVFRATLNCERENANSPCNPITAPRIRFGSEIKVADARRVKLKTPQGKLVGDASLEKKKDGETLYEVAFPAPLEAGATYTIDLPKDLKDLDGRTLSNAKNFPLTFKTAAYPPLVKFAARFGVLEAANPVLPVTVRAVEAQLSTARTDLKTFKVAATEQEFVKWISKIQSKDWNSDTNTSVFKDFPGAKIEKKTLPKPNGSDAFEVMGIPLSGPGFHVVEIESQILGRSLIGTRPMFVASSALVTNLAVHLKQSPQRSLVWVTKLSDGTPVANAQVSVYTCKNVKLASGTTNAQGLFFIESLKHKKEECEAGLNYDLMATASLGNDRSFVLDSWDSGIESYRFNVPYSYSEIPQSDRIFPVLSRSLLRAGETLHMKHIARFTSTQGFRLPTKEETPGAIGIQHMGSDEVQTFAVKFDAKGIAVTEWKIPKEAKLGTYRIVYLKDVSEKPGWESQTAASFRVEEFKVPTLKATIQTEPGPLVQPKSIPASFGLQYLSGGAAAGEKVVVRYQFNERYSVGFEDYDDFTFAQNKVVEGMKRSSGDDDEEGSMSSSPKKNVVTLPLTLDKAGAARANLTPPQLAMQRPGSIAIEMEYRDPNGNVDTASSSVETWSTDLLVGLNPKSWSTTVDKVTMTAVVVDLKGKPQKNVRVKIDQYLRDYYSYRKKLVGGFFGYESSTEIKKLGSFCEGVTDEKGLFTCTQPAAKDGEIIFQASIQDTKGREATTNRSVYVYAKDRMWFDMSDDDRMDVLSDLKEYESGQTAKYQVRMPFKKATALVTVEREGILDAFVTTLMGEKPEVNVSVKPNYSPNAYVSVLAVRGRSDEFKPTALLDLGKPSFKLGIGKMKVGWSAHELKVRAAMDKPVYQTRSKAKMSLQVSAPGGAKLSPDTEVAVVVVDQALLELMPNHSLDLLAKMMQTRTYDIKTATLQTNVIGKRHFGKKALAAGGGGGAETARELFDTLVLWKARVPVSANGEASVEVPLNDSISKFKVAVVATSGEQLFGTGETDFTTTKDIQVIAGLPLIVRENDKFTLEATLRNMTAQKVELVPTVDAGGLKQTSTTVALGPNSSQTVQWNITVPANQQTLKFTVSAATKAGVVRDAVSKVVPVLPAVPVSTLQATLERAQPTTKMTIQLPAEALPQKGEVKVSLKAKLGESLDSVKTAMAVYPWSCFEQRLSKAIVADDKAAWKELSAALPAYLDGNGLIKYWPTMSSGSDVLTSYVLSVTKEAGWEIPKAQLDQMTQALGQFVEGKLSLQERELESKYLTMRKLSAIEALSRYGGDMNPLLSSVQLSPQTWPTHTVLDWWSILQRSKSVTNREKRLKEAGAIVKARLDFRGTRLGFSSEKDDIYSYLMLSPDLNAARLMLEAIALPEWKNEVPRLVRGVMDRRKEGVWYNTTANAWNVLAMRKFSREFEKVTVTGQTSVKMGTQAKAFDWKGPASSGGVVSLARPAGREELNVTHVGAGQPWTTIEIRAAVPLKAAGGNGFRVKKQITGVRRKNPTTWSRGDLVRVKLTFESQTDSTWVVVQDPIPAGSSILGTGLGRDSSMATAGEKSDGSYMAFQEQAADSYRAYYQYVDKGTSSVEYTLRLNQSGVFQLPPTTVQAMYAPDLLGESPNGAFEVKE